MILRCDGLMFFCRQDQRPQSIQLEHYTASRPHRTEQVTLRGSAEAFCVGFGEVPGAPALAELLVQRIQHGAVEDDDAGLTSYKHPCPEDLHLVFSDETLSASFSRSWLRELWQAMKKSGITLPGKMPRNIPGLVSGFRAVLADMFAG